jgi:hypothetical protein
MKTFLSLIPSFIEHAQHLGLRQPCCRFVEPALLACRPSDLLPRPRLRPRDSANGLAMRADVHGSRAAFSKRQQAAAVQGAARTSIACILIALTTTALAQFPSVAFNETAAEFSGRADLDGNGLADVIIVDKASGSMRISYQTAAGVFAWDEPKASGIGQVTGVTAGHLLINTQDTLAVTSPEANRINLLSPSLGASLVPQSVFVTTTGPNCLIASNLIGTIAVDDLWIGSALNAAPLAGSFDQFVNNPVGSFTLAANRHTSGGQFDSASNVIVKTGLVGSIAYLEHLAGSETLRVMSPSEAGAPVRITLAGLPADSSYLITPFAGATLANVLTWKIGDHNFATRRITEPVLGTFTVSGAATVSVPFALGQLILVPTSATTVKLLAISADGISAAYFDFDGANLSAPIQTLTAAVGKQFTGGVALPGLSGFQLLGGNAVDGRTTSARSMKWNANTGRFDDVGGTTFNAIGKRSGSGNVMLFNGEPFVSPTANLIARLNARDWSSGIVLVPPAALNLTGEVFDSSSAGLHSPVSVSLGAAPAGTTNVLLNQARPYLSFFSMSPAEGTAIGEPAIMPNGGSFARTVQLSFSAASGMIVKYRTGNGAWLIYTAPGTQPADVGPGNAAYEAWFANFRPLLIFKNSTVQFYGQIGNKRSAINSAVFKFSLTPDKISELNDGVPDYVKLGQHYNPFEPPPNLLATEQGGFLNRLLDVNDTRSLSSSALDLYVRPMSINGYSNSIVPSLMVGAALADGTTGFGNSITAFDGGGVFLAASDQIEPVPDPVPSPGLRLWQNSFVEPTARLSHLYGANNGGFALLATESNFAIATPAPSAAYSSVIGRQLIGLMAMPSFPASYYQRSYTGGSDAAEAAAWISGATLFYNNKGVPTEARTLDSLDTMATLIFERWLLLACLQRNLLPSEYTPAEPSVDSPRPLNPNYLTLTAFRSNESARAISSTPSGAVFMTPEQLRSLEVSAPPSDAYRLSEVIDTIQKTLRTSSDHDIATLRMVCDDVYRVSSRYANEVRAGFVQPVDALRYFLAIGVVPPIYGNKVLRPNNTNPPTPPLPGAPYSALTDETFTTAMIGMTKVLGQVQARPYDDFELITRADSVQANCTLLDLASGGSSVSLRSFDGSLFEFPVGFDISPGTHIHLTAYTDLPAGPCGPEIEVVDLTSQITALPLSTPQAGNNLLPDDWELFFFGQTGIDPFATPPGSNVSYLQLYLDGKDPLNAGSYTGVPSLLNAMPQLVISGGQSKKLNFKLPAAYANKFTFQLQTTTDLTGFINTPDAVVQTSPGQFEITPPASNGPRQFWRLGLGLK